MVAVFQENGGTIRPLAAPELVAEPLDPLAEPEEDPLPPLPPLLPPDPDEGVPVSLTCASAGTAAVPVAVATAVATVLSP